jgi:chemotaxis protein methyltransferase CheR
MREFLKSETAIVLEEGKEYLVETRLAPLLRKSGIQSLERLIGEIRTNRAHPLKKGVLDALTTNETSFFRDLEPFEVLRTVVIPDLLAKRASTRKLAIWSAACSTGQEPYSIAMLLRDAFPALADWDVSIHATDICSTVLERARAGVFTQMEVNRGLPALYLVKYFKKCGNEWQISDQIRSSIRFSELNLMKPFTALPPVDIVFIRNVLIYFDLQTKQQILNRVRSVLKPDGFLFLGSAETTLNIDSSFVRTADNKGSCFQLKQGGPHGA